MKTTDFERFTLRVSIDSQVKSWLKIGANLSGAAITRNNGVDGVSSPTSYVNPYRWTRNMGPIYSPYMHDAVTGRRVMILKLVWKCLIREIREVQMPQLVEMLLQKRCGIEILQGIIM